MDTVAEVFAALTVMALAWGVAAWRAARLGRTSAILSFLSGRDEPDAPAPAERRGSARGQAPLPWPLRSVERRAREAGVVVDPRTVLALVAGGGIGLGVLALSVTGQLWVAGLAALGGLYAPNWYLQRLARRRARLAEAQLDQLARHIAQGMRAGLSLQQALADVAERMPPPLGDDLRRVVRSVRLAGTGMAQAVADLARGFRLPDMQLLVAAMRLHIETGADLPLLLDNLSRTLARRRDARNALLAATAQGRVQSYILIALPFFLLFVMRLMYPTYLDPLLNTSGGRVVFIAAMGWLALGWVMMQRLLGGAGHAEL